MLVVVIFVVKGAHTTPISMPTGTDLADITNQVTHVSPSVFATVGTGSVKSPLKPTGSSEPVAVDQGKPLVLYVGAEFCPYCASERWSLIAALSRFGELQNLEATASMSNDVFPNTPTFSFAKSTYSSPYATFVSVETATRNQQPLQRPSSSQQAAMTQYDPPGSIPFIDIGGRYVTVGSGYDPGLLSGKDWKTIAAVLSDPNSPVTQNIIGNANYLTAAICKVTENQPSSVCESPEVVAAAAELGS